MQILDRFRKLVQIQSNHKLERSEDRIIQHQVAGKDSIQNQFGTVIYNEGISEERVRAIFLEMIPIAIDKYINEAQEVACLRIKKFEETFIPKVMEIESAITAFSDPYFQILLRKAQQSAAATENNDDFALLSELLIFHVQKGEDRKKRFAIKKAIEIVDDIEYDALCGLSIVYAVENFIPDNGSVKKGLFFLDKLFSCLLYTDPPKGRDWIGHLDDLGAVRLSSVDEFKSIQEYYSEVLNGYACVGIKINSDEHKKAIDLMNDAGIPKNILVQNELIEGYVRLSIVSNRIIKILSTFWNPLQSRALNPKEIEALESIWKLYSRDNNLLNLVQTKFIECWDSYDSLKRVRRWWEKIPNSFEITMVGRVLAYTNSKRYDSNLPDVM